MKKYLPLIMLFIILFAGCGQRSYSPAVITSSRLNVSSSSVQSIETSSTEIFSAVLSTQSQPPSKTSSAISSAVSSQKSSAVSAEPSSKFSSVVASASLAASSQAASSKETSSQRSSTVNSFSSAMSSIPPSVTIGGDIEVVFLTSPIVHGQDASITIKGTPGVEYAIKVLYKSGPSTASGLGPKTAGPDGMVTWGWKVSSRTTPGSWSIEISGGGASITVPFIVTD